MGMLACYMEADKYLLADFLTKAADELLDALYDREDAGELRILDIDKMWDGLHCLLTGVSASAPPEDNPLSEAALGSRLFAETDEYVAYIMPQRLPQIVEAMDNFAVDKALADFKPQEFARKKIYPNIWRQEDAAELRTELEDAFSSLYQFYKELAADGKGVIVSIL